MNAAMEEASGYLCDAGSIEVCSPGERGFRKLAQQFGSISTPLQTFRVL